MLITKNQNKMITRKIQSEIDFVSATASDIIQMLPIMDGLATAIHNRTDFVVGIQGGECIMSCVKAAELFATLFTMGFSCGNDNQIMDEVAQIREETRR